MDAIAKESNKKPEIIVFAGPNGSGKSTFTDLLKPPVDYINADEIKKNLKCDDLTAAQIAEKQREDHLKNREDFCFETVMSTPRNLNLLQRAKDAGYFIRCYYILTVDPFINVYRVKSRVAEGGHDVVTKKAAGCKGSRPKHAQPSGYLFPGIFPGDKIDSKGCQDRQYRK